jgi:hypothetical protein
MLFQFHLRARAVLGRVLLDVAALAPADLRHAGNIRLPPMELLTLQRVFTADKALRPRTTLFSPGACSFGPHTG